MRRHTVIALARVLAYASLPAALILIPTRWIETHPAPCLYRVMFKRNCPGCGLARALSSAVHGHFRRSLAYNELVVIVLPLSLLVWLRGVSVAYRELVRAGRP